MSNYTLPMIQGLHIIQGDHLPPRTIVVSPDVFKMLKEQTEPVKAPDMTGFEVAL